MLLDQTKVYAEHFAKTEAKRWSFREYDESDEAIALSCVDFQISLADAYNKVKLEEEDAEQTD